MTYREADKVGDGDESFSCPGQRKTVVPELAPHYIALQILEGGSFA